MSLFGEAKQYLEWENSKASLRLPLPILEVVLPENLVGDEKSLIEKILQSLPFEVSGFEKVTCPKTHFCIDFTGEHSMAMASMAIKDLLQDAEKKKLLWQKLLSFGASPAA